MKLKKKLADCSARWAIGIVLASIPSVAFAQVAGTPAPATQAPATQSTGTQAAGTQVAQADSAPAQQTASSNTASNSTPGGQGGLEQIVVTGVPTAGGLKKLDTAFSVTTLSADQILEMHPITSADLLKASPGLFIESTGGQTGANIEIAGFPSNGGSPYATFLLNGSPFFPMSQQTILTGTDLLRLDETIERVDLVQGGPGVLYTTGQPGLTANYVLKRGTDTFKGDVGFTYGSEGSERIDAFAGFPLDKDNGIYGSIGGYWHISDGVRDPQYTAEQGGQLTATVSKEWTQGSLLVYGRYENFKEQFVTDTPFNDPTPGNFQPFAGFPPLTGTQGSKADQYEQLQVSPCTGAGCSPGTIPINMQNGRGPNFYTLGSNFTWDFGNGLQFLDNANYTNGKEHLNAFYSSGINPTVLSTFITNTETANKLPTNLAVNAYYTNTGAAADLSQSITTQELRSIQEAFHAETNEARLSYDLFPGNTLTVGNYTAFYGATVVQYSGAKMLLQAVTNPTPIGIKVSNATTTYQLASSQGFVNGPTGAQNNPGNAFNTAFFFSDSWRFGDFLLDFGGRYEHQTMEVRIANTATGSLSGDPTQIFNNNAVYLTSGSTPLHYSHDGLSWTVGLNYTFSPNMSAYVRANDGVHFAAFSDLTAALPDLPLQNAQNFQGGWKYQTDWLYADLSAFYRVFANVSIPPTAFLVPGSNPPLTEKGTFAYGSHSQGFEYAVTLTPFDSGLLERFALTTSGDYSYGNYTHSSGCISFTGLVNTLACNASFQYNGHLLTRQPTFQTRITPSYTLPTSWGSLKGWATVEYINKHYADFLEQQPLPEYYDLSIGLSAFVGENWEVNLYGTNMTNQVGLTEDNATGIPAGPTVLARSIDGREVAFQVKYKF